MDVREKLVKLLGSVSCNGNGESLGSCPDRKYGLCREVANLSYCVIQNTANYLVAHGVTVQDNTEITDEHLKQFRNAPITALHEEPTIEVVREWISVSERLPQNFVSVLGYMTDAGEFPPVRECYTVGNAFFFPALGDIHPVSHWCEFPQPPKGE